MKTVQTTKLNGITVYNLQLRLIPHSIWICVWKIEDKKTKDRVEHLMDNCTTSLTDMCQWLLARNYLWPYLGKVSVQLNVGTDQLRQKHWPYPNTGRDRHDSLV